MSSTDDRLEILGRILRASCGLMLGTYRQAYSLLRPELATGLRLMAREGLFRIVYEHDAEVRGYWPEDDPEIIKPPRPQPTVRERVPLQKRPPKLPKSKRPPLRGR